MSSDIIDLTIKHATLQKATCGGRYSVMQPDKIWFVAEGTVDLFLTSISQVSSEIQNTFHWIARINAGEFFLGTSDLSNKNIILLARNCTHTKVFFLAKEIINKIDPKCKAYILNGIDKFIFDITQSVSDQVFQTNLIDIATVTDDSFTLSKNQGFYTSQGVQWLNVERNILIFNKNKQTTFQAQNHFFPVTSLVQLEAEQDLKLSVYTIHQITEQDNFWPSLEKYMLLIFDLKLFQVEKQVILENISLQKRIKVNQLALQESFNLLTESFLSKKNVVHFDNQNEPIYLASKQIANFLNIPLNPLSLTESSTDQMIYFKNLMTAAKIFYRKVKLSANWHQQNHGPLLAFKKKEHIPVALIPNKKNAYIIHDTQQNTVLALTTENSQQFSEEAYVFYENPSKVSIKILFRLALIKIKSALRNVLVYCAATSLLGLLIPILTQIIFDHVIISNERNQLFQIITILLATMISIGLFEIAKRTILLNIETKIDCNVHSIFWDHILKLPIKFFQKFTAGELTSRIGNLIEIRLNISGVTLPFLLNSIFSFTSFLVLFYYQFYLATIVTVFILSFWIISFYLLKKRITLEELVLAKNAKIFGILSEFFSNISKIRLSGAQCRAFLIWSKEFSSLQQIIIKSQKIITTGTSIIEIMPLFIFAVMIVSIYAFSSIQNTFSMGSFLAFNIALSQTVITFFNLMEEMNRIILINPLFKKTKIFIDESIESLKNNKNPGVLKGKIELNNVSFQYDNTSKYILNNISLEINPGEYVAIVGKSGSGKSTLLKLLLGFEHPSQGKIFYDNDDISNLDLDLLRKQIGIVLQHDELLPGNIYSNISGTSDLTIDEAWQMAEMANIDQDILQMPMQMNTVLNVEGMGLSGGQKQRLLIARAIARKPKILILDEAMRSIDNINQSKLLEILSHMKMTRIIIAHRLSTLMKVDKIFVLQEGEIIEVGSYHELLQKKGTFYHLVQKQIISNFS